MKTKVKLGMNKMSVPELMSFSIHVVSKMNGNTHFPVPQPALDKITNAITALQNAFDLAQGAGPQQTATMHQHKMLLETMLTALGNYVESVANDVANAETGAETIILSSGMNVKQFTPHQKQTFRVKAGNLPGTILLFAESVKRGSHEWQYNNPPADGWTDAEPTVQASTMIMGLESGKRYSFRHRTVLPGGTTAWGDPESILVV